MRQWLGVHQPLRVQSCRSRERAIVLEGGNHAPCILDLRGVDLGHDKAGRLARVGKDLAPRIDDQRMTVGLAPARMLAALRGAKT